MKTASEARSQRAKKCRHYRYGRLPGVDHGPKAPRCDAGADPTKAGVTCIGIDNPHDGTCATCDRYEPQTDEEISARERQIEHSIECLRRNVSSCCEAALDERQVIRGGRYDGHGPRFCTKCGKLVYMV